MSDQFTVAIIENKFLSYEFAEVAARCLNAGFRVLIYKCQNEFQSSVSDYAIIDAILCLGNTPFTADVLDLMPRLRVLLSAVTGTEGFDIEAATARNILVGNGQTQMNYTCMAESTILLVLAALYRLDETRRILRENLPRPSPLNARALYRKKLGFVGFGKIAQEMAVRLTSWGVEMQAYVHRANPNLAKLNVQAVTLDELLKGSDIVSLNCSLNEQTKHILNAERLALMRPEAILVNTARGALIDEAALAIALKEKRISYAALDTFEVEPLSLESPLRELPNVMLTPHMVGHTAETNQTILETAWNSLINASSWRPPIYVKNPGALTRWKSKELS